VLAGAGATSTMAQATSTGLGLGLRLGFVEIRVRVRARVRVSVMVRFCGHYVDIVAANCGRLRLQPTVTSKFDLGWALPRTPAEGAYSKSVKK